MLILPLNVLSANTNEFQMCCLPNLARRKKNWRFLAFDQFTLSWEVCWKLEKKKVWYSYSSLHTEMKQYKTLFWKLNLGHLHYLFVICHLSFMTSVWLGVFQLWAVDQRAAGITSVLLVTAAELPLSCALNQGWETFSLSRVISVFIMSLVGCTKLLNTYTSLSNAMAGTASCWRGVWCQKVVMVILPAADF